MGDLIQGLGYDMTNDEKNEIETQDDKSAVKKALYYYSKYTASLVVIIAILAVVIYVAAGRIWKRGSRRR